MRLFVSVAMLGLMAAVPAMAQQTNTNAPTAPTGPMIYAVPVYNGMSGTPQYQQGTPTFYNNAAQAPLPLNQLAAGKNAPSYNYNNSGQTPAYTGFTGNNPLSGMDYANLTPEQRRYLDQQEAARYQQQQYLQQQQQQQRAQQQLGQANSYLGGGSLNPFAQPEQKPKQRRVVYNERNNPLVTPPRLFNPDQ